MLFTLFCVCVKEVWNWNFEEFFLVSCQFIDPQIWTTQQHRLLLIGSNLSFFVPCQESKLQKSSGKFFSEWFSSFYLELVKDQCETNEESFIHFIRKKRVDAESLARRSYTFWVRSASKTYTLLDKFRHPSWSRNCDIAGGCDAATASLRLLITSRF